MTTINKVFADKGTGPYSMGVKVQVLEKDSPQKYRSKDGIERSVLSVAVSDGTDVIKVQAYDASTFLKFEVGASLLLRNFIRKSENGERVLVLTSTSKVITSFGKYQPTSDLLTLARRIISPPPTEVIPIAKALTSPLKKKLSLKCKIIQEDEPRNVTVKGESVQIKNITVEDGTGKVKVALWREVSNTNLRPGDYISITDVVVNVYQNVTSLSTTSRSKLESGVNFLCLCQRSVTDVHNSVSYVDNYVVTYCESHPPSTNSTCHCKHDETEVSVLRSLHQYTIADLPDDVGVCVWVAANNSAGLGPKNSNQLYQLVTNQGSTSVGLIVVVCIIGVIGIVIGGFFFKKICLKVKERLAHLKGFHDPHVQEDSMIPLHGDEDITKVTEERDMYQSPIYTDIDHNTVGDDSGVHLTGYSRVDLIKPLGDSDDSIDSDSESVDIPDNDGHKLLDVASLNSKLSDFHDHVVDMDPSDGVGKNDDSLSSAIHSEIEIVQGDKSEHKRQHISGKVNDKTLLSDSDQHIPNKLETDDQLPLLNHKQTDSLEGECKDVNSICSNTDHQSEMKLALGDNNSALQSHNHLPVSLEARNEILPDLSRTNIALTATKPVVYGAGTIHEDGHQIGIDSFHTDKEASEEEVDEKADDTESDSGSMDWNVGGLEGYMDVTNTNPYIDNDNDWPESLIDDSEENKNYSPEFLIDDSEENKNDGPKSHIDNAFNSSMNLDDGFSQGEVTERLSEDKHSVTTPGEIQPLQSILDYDKSSNKHPIISPGEIPPLKSLSDNGKSSNKHRAISPCKIPPLKSLSDNDKSLNKHRAISPCKNPPSKSQTDDGTSIDKLSIISHGVIPPPKSLPDVDTSVVGSLSNILDLDLHGNLLSPTEDKTNNKELDTLTNRLSVGSEASDKSINSDGHDSAICLSGDSTDSYQQSLKCNCKDSSVHCPSFNKGQDKQRELSNTSLQTSDYGGSEGQPNESSGFGSQTLKEKWVNPADLMEGYSHARIIDME